MNQRASGRSCSAHGSFCRPIEMMHTIKKGNSAVPNQPTSNFTPLLRLNRASGLDAEEDSIVSTFCLFTPVRNWGVRAWTTLRDQGSHTLSSVIACPGRRHTYMKLRRKHRILTALIALFGVLFTQLAMAAYACPSLIKGNQRPATMAGDPSPMQSMPGCDQPDQAEPALCVAHCQDAKSTLDKPDLPAVRPAAVIVSSIPAALAPPLLPSLPDVERDSLLRRITSPPISIRHCCFRI